MSILWQFVVIFPMVNDVFYENIWKSPKWPHNKEKRTIWFTMKHESRLKPKFNKRRTHLSIFCCSNIGEISVARKTNLFSAKKPVKKMDELLRKNIIIFTIHLFDAFLIIFVKNLWFFWEKYVHTFFGIL